MAELDRLGNVLPIFLWLWEHRAEVKPLLRDGASWRALSAGLQRLGFVDRSGAPAREEYCRAAWARVLAYEPIILRHADGGPPAPHMDTPVPVQPGIQVPAPSPDTAAPPGPGAAPGLGELLAKARRPMLAEPPPLNVAGRARRPADDGDAS